MEITDEWCFRQFLEGETASAVQGWKEQKGKALADLLAGVRWLVDYFTEIATDEDQQQEILTRYREYVEDWDEEIQGARPVEPTFHRLNPRTSLILTELSSFLYREEQELNPLASIPSSMMDSSYPYMHDLVVGTAEPQLTRNALSLVRACKRELFEFPDLRPWISAALTKAERDLLRALGG